MGDQYPAAPLRRKSQAPDLGVFLHELFFFLKFPLLWVSNRSDGIVGGGVGGEGGLLRMGAPNVAGRR